MPLFWAKSKIEKTLVQAAFLKKNGIIRRGLYKIISNNQYAPTEIILSQILKLCKVHTPEQLPMSRQSVVKDKCSLVVPFFRR